MPWAVPCPSVHQSPLPKGYMCNWGRDTSAHQALAWLKVSPVPLVSFPPSTRVSPGWAGTLPWPSSYPSSLLFPVEVQTLTCLVSSASSPAGPPLLIPLPLQTGLHAAWGRITQFQHSASCCTDPGENSRQRGLPVGSGGKEPTCNAGDLGLIPGLGRSPEEEMATHCSILAWRIPWTEERGGLQSMGLQRVGHDWATEQAQLNKTEEAPFTSPPALLSCASVSFSLKPRNYTVFQVPWKCSVTSCLSEFAYAFPSYLNQ